VNAYWGKKNKGLHYQGADTGYLQHIAATSQDMIEE